MAARSGVVLVFDVGSIEKFKCGKTILIGYILRIALGDQ
jgi:hypothetical protein